jgi:hypothetical protein
MGSRGAIIMSFFGAVFIAMTLHWQWHLSGLPLALPFAVFVMIGLGALRVMRLPGRASPLRPAPKRPSPGPALVRGSVCSSPPIW